MHLFPRMPDILMISQFLPVVPSCSQSPGKCHSWLFTFPCLFSIPWKVPSIKSLSLPLLAFHSHHSWGLHPVLSFCNHLSLEFSESTFSTVLEVFGQNDPPNLSPVLTGQWWLPGEHDLLAYHLGPPHLKSPRSPALHCSFPLRHIFNSPN